ncbi:hypothetical protein C0991_003743 [Blastosporella zonata]|nr:hypothetical protein C0991_003743 [Blastosporella zonata]
MATPNSLGLDFDQLSIQDPSSAQPEAAPLNPPPNVEIKVEKKKPYVNAERVKTGGSQRDKMSEEALTERMARMKEQNEKIKQRRLVCSIQVTLTLNSIANLQDVKADEEAFRKTQESERVKLAQIRKVQESVDRTREQNAKRKMDKIQSREWDSGKPTGDWKHQSKKTEGAAPQITTEDANNADPPVSVEAAGSPPRDTTNWVRGSPRGGPHRGRGRGRGRGGSANLGSPQPDAKSDDAKPVADAQANIPTSSEST